MAMAVGGHLRRPPEIHVSGPSAAVLDRACTPAHSLSGSCSAPPANLCHQSPILQTTDDTAQPAQPPINLHDPAIAPRTFRITSKICNASSRVGDSTIAPSPCARSQLARYRLSSSGIANASVLPEPVLAAPNTSRPASRWGIAALWMAVMSVYAAALSPRRVRLERGKCSNLLAVASVGRLAASALLLFLPLVGAPGTLCNTVVMGWQGLIWLVPRAQVPRDGCAPPAARPHRNRCLLGCSWQQASWRCASCGHEPSFTSLLTGAFVQLRKLCMVDWIYG